MDWVWLMGDRFEELSMGKRGDGKTLRAILTCFKGMNNNIWESWFEFWMILHTWRNHKPVLKRHNMLWLRKYLVRHLGCYFLKYSWRSFFLRGAISNLGTLFYTALRLKKKFKIGPWYEKTSNSMNEVTVWSLFCSLCFILKKRLNKTSKIV